MALAVLGLFVLATGLLSLPIERAFFVSRPMLALAIGLALGPGLGWLDPHAWGHDPHGLLSHAAELTIAIALMSIALRLPGRYFRRRARTMLVLLGLLVPLMAAAAAVVTGGVFGWPPLVCALVGAAVAPTDPVLATTIAHGSVAREHLPARLRHVLSAESGANDGLAAPVFFLPLLLLTSAAPAAAVGEWVWRPLLWETLAGAGLGLALGAGTGKAVLLAEEKRSMETPSFLSLTVALSLLALGAAKLVHANGILAVFAAGMGFNQRVGSRLREQEEHVQDAVDQFFTMPIFIFVGLLAPVQAWWDLGASGLLWAAGILLLRRLPALLLLRRAACIFRDRREALFAGWFGPIGIAALYYALLAKHRAGLEHVWAVVSLAVAASVVVHGVTAPLWTRRMKPSRYRP